jgi:predicted flap endonuclease-1-like 5' DNA nuclease
MSLLTCCFWWFLLGLLIGWLLNWLLSRMIRKEPPSSTASRTTYSPPASAATSSTKGVDLNAARAAGFSLRHVDDLQVIEGIGPKIDELLRINGVTTFAQVARMTPAELRAVLDRGGPHFNMANPSTWPHQATLALENRWSELKKVHHELTGGGSTPTSNL